MGQGHQRIKELEQNGSAEDVRYKEVQKIRNRNIPTKFNHEDVT